MPIKYVYHWLSDDVDELYDLEVDPGEMENLYLDPGHQGIAKKLREGIVLWANETGHNYAPLIAMKHHHLENTGSSP